MIAVVNCERLTCLTAEQSEASLVYCHAASSEISCGGKDNLQICAIIKH